MSLATEAGKEYGEWVARMAPWSGFVTLTHRSLIAAPGEAVVTIRKHRTGGNVHTRLGIKRHNREVREWFHETVRRIDRGACWWSETELHESGQPHEHGLLAVSASAPIYSMLDDWFRRPGGGAWNYKRLPTEGDLVRVAEYVGKAAKYAGKLAGQPPKVWGLGVHTRESFAIAHPGLLGSRSAVDSASASAGAGRDVQCAPEPSQRNTAPRTST